MNAIYSFFRNVFFKNESDINDTNSKSKIVESDSNYNKLDDEILKLNSDPISSIIDQDSKNCDLEIELNKMINDIVIETLFNKNNYFIKTDITDEDINIKLHKIMQKKINNNKQ